MTESLGERLIEAAAAKEFGRAGELLAADVEFRALTPRKLFERDGRDAMLGVIEDWFAPVDAIEVIEADMVVDRPGVRYRIRWSTPEEGSFVFEQHAFYDVVDGQISRIHLVCSGDRALDGANGNA